VEEKKREEGRGLPKSGGVKKKKGERYIVSDPRNPEKRGGRRERGLITPDQDKRKPRGKGRTRTIDGLCLRPTSRRVGGGKGDGAVRPRQSSMSGLEKEKKKGEKISPIPREKKKGDQSAYRLTEKDRKVVRICGKGKKRGGGGGAGDPDDVYVKV